MLVLPVHVLVVIHVAMAVTMAMAMVAMLPLRRRLQQDTVWVGGCGCDCCYIADRGQDGGFNAQGCTLWEVPFKDAKYNKETMMVFRYAHDSTNAV